MLVKREQQEDASVNVLVTFSYLFPLILTYSYLFLLFSLTFFTYYLHFLLITFFNAYCSLLHFLKLIITYYFCLNTMFLTYLGSL